MAETMSMKVLAALQAGAKTLAEVTERSGMTRPKAYATLHQLKLEGKATRTGPRGWERGRWALTTDAASSTSEPEERKRSSMPVADRLAG